jgi:hypothetical protein
MEHSMAYMELEFPADPEDARVRSRRNISDVERWLSAIAGTALTAYGLSRRRSSRWALTALGAMLVQRGATGHCHTYEAFGINTAGTGEDTRRALRGQSSTASGATWRTCRSSCLTSYRWSA